MFCKEFVPSSAWFCTELTLNDYQACTVANVCVYSAGRSVIKNGNWLFRVHKGSLAHLPCQRVKWINLRRTWFVIEATCKHSLINIVRKILDHLAADPPSVLFNYILNQYWKIEYWKILSQCTSVALFKPLSHLLLLLDNGTFTHPKGSLRGSPLKSNVENLPT